MTTPENKQLQLTQIALLALGNVIAWWEVVMNINEYCGSGGSLRSLEFYGLTNPLATPCFYGAIAFLVALIWSIQVYRHKSQQKYLNYLLGFGTIFAGVNTGYTFYKYNVGRGTDHFGCALDKIANPFTTACFYGAIIFLLVFIVGIILHKHPTHNREDTKSN